MGLIAVVTGLNILEFSNSLFCTMFREWLIFIDPAMFSNIVGTFFKAMEDMNTISLKGQNFTVKNLNSER